MQLYEFGPTRSIRARWILQELGVAFETVPVNLMAGEHRRAPLLALNPAGKIPVLVDGERVSAADIVVAYTLDWGDVAGLLEGFPALDAYLRRMYARPRAPRHIRELLHVMQRPASA